MRQLALSVAVATCAALVLLLLVSVEGAYYPSDCCCNSTHNFFFGRRSPYDRLLFSNHTVVPARPYGKYSVDVTLPPRPSYPQPVITYVEVLDAYRDGLGACARIRSGGLGRSSISLTLSSSLNHPINSIVNAFGHY